MNLKGFFKIFLMISPLIFLILYFSLINIHSSQNSDNSSKNESQNFTLDNSYLTPNITQPSIQQTPIKSADPRDSMDIWYWTLPIHYTFSKDSSCSDETKMRVQDAMNIINKNTDNYVSFQEDSDLTNTSGDYKGIYFSCIDQYNDTPRSETEGDASFYYYIGTREISSGSIELYKPNRAQYEYCMGYPDVEIHEILHTMGLDHITGRASIMNSIAQEGCFNLDKEISDCLEYIYSKGQQNYSCQGIPFQSESQ